MRTETTHELIHDWDAEDDMRRSEAQLGLWTGYNLPRASQAPPWDSPLASDECDAFLSSAFATSLPVDEEIFYGR